MLVAAITDEQPFFVRDAVRRRVGIIAVVRGIVFPATFKCHRQTARRIHVSEKNLGQCCAALLAWIPGLQDCGDAIEPGVHIHCAARRDHHDRVVICRCDLLD